MITFLAVIIAHLRGVVELDNVPQDWIGTVLEPFTDVMGNWFWAILWTSIAAGVYIKSEGVALPTVIMILSTVFVAATLDVSVVYLYAVLAAAGMASIFYKLYRRNM